HWNELEYSGSNPRKLNVRDVSRAENSLQKERCAEFVLIPCCDTLRCRVNYSPSRLLFRALHSELAVLAFVCPALICWSQVCFPSFKKPPRWRPPISEPVRLS